MLRNRLLSMLFLLFAALGAAQAHTHLKASTPADNAVLETPPAELKLQFSEATRLTALSLQKEGAKEKTALQGLPKEAAAAITVSLTTPLTPGKYTVSWRAVGKDNHVMSGDVRFTIKSK